MKDSDLANHIVFSSLIPAVRLAKELGISLAEIKRLAELATFRELRSKTSTHRKIAELLSISTAKVGLLSRQLKDRFSQSDGQTGLRRRILSVLWASALSEIGITRALRDEESGPVSSSLRKLVKDGLVEEIPGRTVRYKLAESRYRLDKEPWTAKIDALNNLMSNIANAAIGRLRRRDERAFVRTLQFHVCESELEKLHKFYEEGLFPLVQTLDDSAQRKTAEAVPVQLSIAWAPEYDHLLGPQTGNSES